MLSLSLRGRRGNRNEQKPLDLVVDCPKCCLLRRCLFHQSRQPSHVTCYCKMFGDKQQTSKQANKQTSKTNQSSSCTHMFASCLCTVMVRFGSFLSIHSTAATGDSFQVLPQRSHVSHWWSAPQKLKATAERRLRAEHQSISVFPRFSKIWSCGPRIFRDFSKTLGRSWQWPNSCALLSLDLARRSSQPWH